MQCTVYCNMTQGVALMHAKITIRVTKYLAYKITMHHAKHMRNGQESHGKWALTTPEKRH